MSRGSSGIVAGLTAAALVAVGVLAFQASANAPDNLAAPKPKASATATEHAKPKKKSRPAALPKGSGTGTRVVYALADRRVWLVDGDGKVTRTFDVMPSSLNPLPGTYRVNTPRSGAPTKGSDGVMIEHVVRFAMVDDVAVGFSAAVDGSMESPDPTLKTGGVRMSRADGDAMWDFAMVGTKVVVVR
ncbi:L,D-transpeptidase [Streptomyces sp. NBC_01363]|uniref:L,D-transpeptidase n=1 Tax=Streptomyces sp. NBC_01363 TaxID=2903840 RepID=UPI00225493F0|nr:L,D-transpeptidase [Streptomyces sp. NBC_01363]MCX4730101.1 L,D-transpeptidase [Streptomyces sp. NBC_01363]